jgi:hypothetical protein
MKSRESMEKLFRKCKNGDESGSFRGSFGGDWQAE